MQPSQSLGKSHYLTSGFICVYLGEGGTADGIAPVPPIERHLSTHKACSCILLPVMRSPTSQQEPEPERTGKNTRTLGLRVTGYPAQADTRAQNLGLGSGAHFQPRTLGYVLLRVCERGVGGCTRPFNFCSCFLSVCLFF